MGNRSNPRGVRLGVTPRGVISAKGTYHGYKDIKGWSSRWTTNTATRQGTWSQRDHQIRELLEEWATNEGRVVNHTQVYRTAGYVGVYVDVYKVWEERLVTGPYGPQRGLHVPRGSGGKVKATGTLAVAKGGQGKGGKRWTGPEVGTAGLEDLVSRRLEGGKPVSIQLVCLNEYLLTVDADHWRELNDAVVAGRRRTYRWDRRQATTLLGRVPSAVAWSKRISKRRSAQQFQARTFRGRRELLDGFSESQWGLWTLGPDLEAREKRRKGGKARGTRKRGRPQALKEVHPRVSEQRRSRGALVGQREPREGGREERAVLEERVWKTQRKRVEKSSGGFGGVKGLVWSVKGRLGGRDRARGREHRKGSIPHHTRTAARDCGEVSIDTGRGARWCRLVVCYN